MEGVSSTQFAVHRKIKVEVQEQLSTLHVRIGKLNGKRIY